VDASVQQEQIERWVAIGREAGAALEEQRERWSTDFVHD
jgi:hypothetical protein